MTRKVSPMLTDTSPSGTLSKETEEFSRVMEQILRSWHFPNLERVTFNEKEHDVIISGRSRTSHGKGIRAITHAAFNLALLKYCNTKPLPHPGNVVIDSPLVVYKEPDKDESLDPEVKDLFYREIAVAFSSSQVIIFENDDPPMDVSNIATVIRFTGTDHGRRGFIPSRS